MNDDNRRVFAFGRRDQRVVLVDQQRQRTVSYGQQLPPATAPAAPYREPQQTVSMRRPQVPATGVPPASAPRMPAPPPGQAPMPRMPAPPPGQAPMPRMAAPAPRVVVAPCRPTSVTPKVQAVPDPRRFQVIRRSDVMDALRDEII